MKSLDWCYLEKLNVEEQWSAIKNKILQQMDENIPKKTNKESIKTKPKWITNIHAT